MDDSILLFSAFLRARSQKKCEIGSTCAGDAGPTPVRFVSSPGLVQRKQYGKGRAPPQLALDLDRAAMGPDDPVDNRQPQPAIAPFGTHARRIDLVEPVEEI